MVGLLGFCNRLKRWLTRKAGEQAGQALPAVLAVMLLGGLAVPPLVDHAATGLKSTRGIGEGVLGIYAAEAGVENGIWYARQGLTAPAQLPDPLNGMQVSVQTEDRGTYTAYFGELVPAGEHSVWLDVGGDIAGPVDGVYEYTITVTWQPVPGTPTIHIGEVGVKLPPGYSYQTGSAALFTGNLSSAEPQIVYDDGTESYMYRWAFSSPNPSVDKQNPTRTQKLRFSGSGELDDEYAWTVAVRTDVGVVGEIVGSLYLITGTAVRPGTGEVVGRVLELPSFKKKSSADRSTPSR